MVNLHLRSSPPPKFSKLQGGWWTNGEGKRYSLVVAVHTRPSPSLLSKQPSGRSPKGQPPGDFAFENTSTSVAASQMRNALNNLADTVSDPEQKKLFETEMDNFFALFRRYLNDKAKGNQLRSSDWDRIAPPAQNQVVDYNELANSESVSFLNKLAVLKLNGGLGTSMGCVGPKSVIEVRDGMSFLDLSVRQIEYLNRTYSVNVPFVLMNSFNTDDDTQNIIKKYEGHNIDILTFNQSRYPRILKDSLLPAPKSFDSPISDWYPPGHGDVFESLYNSGILDTLIKRGVEIVFLSNVDNLAPLIKLGNDFKKVSDFQKRIGSIPKIIELDHLTITGAVNLGRGVTLKGTVIIVATEGSTIDIPPGSILENVVVQGSLRLLEH
ncbi:UTP-glucose-1-phosphate uridylyltransferase protein [Rutstroemia sp. NJR-2017a BVV2]|nr:UTP-glucose-1-phosphate uridylyltransferase protein [Rutstroemia sp. NJR-2017a BVV2]